MTFLITITHDRKTYRFKVQKLASDQSFDYYRVSGRNRSITFRNNSPVLKRNNLKHRAPTWKVVEGDVWNVTFKERIVQALSREINGQL